MKIKKTVYSSAKLEDVGVLSDYINKFSVSTDKLEKEKLLLEIRKVLGVVAERFHKASLIYKLTMKGYPKTNDLDEIISDLSNINRLKSLLGILETLVQDFSKYLESQSSNKYLFSNFENTKNLTVTTINLIHYVENMNFTPNQIESLKRISEGGVNQDYIEEVDASRMQSVLQGSLYSIKDDSDKTLRVIREMLQNAVDAVISSKIESGVRGQVDIITAKLSSGMDLYVKDNGIGMNWEVLSRKFFVYFATGKGDSSTSAGGFGVAKALIQETPKEGWSVDTNAIHSGRFHRNMYFGNPKEYSPPSSKIQPLVNGGSIFTLYNIPFVDNYSIMNIASNYNSGIENLDVYVNGNLVPPKFNFTDLKKLENSSSLVDSGVSGMERLMIEDLLEKQKEKSLGSITINGKNSTSNIDFYLKFYPDRDYPHYGSYYIYLNKQYQFMKSTGIKLDIVVLINTTSRPGTDDYPVDPGRENLRPPYLENVSSVVDSISGIFRKISESEILRDGMNMTILNEGSPEMEIKSELDSDVSIDLENENEDEETDKNTSEEQIKHNSRKEKIRNLATILQNAYSMKGVPETQNVSTGFSLQQGEDDIQRKIENIEFLVKDEVGSLSQQQQSILRASVESLVDSIKDKNDEKFTWIERAKEMIERLMTPCVISVQKNFIPHETAMNNFSLISDLVIIWQKTLKIISESIAESSYSDFSRGRKFIPGIVYSNECIALYMPPKGEKKRHMLLINPITAAAVTHPDLFAQLSDVSKEALSEGKSDTPINRVSDFLFHEAIHEITHFMFPDYGLERFHLYVTKIEVLCHHRYPEIRNVVKEHMPGLKRNMRKLITMIKRERKTSSYQDGFVKKSNKTKIYNHWYNVSKNICEGR